MSDETVEKHQLAGLDERARGFNRVVEVRRIEQAYRATLAYETRHFSADDNESGQTALQLLICRLHTNGFTQLRSQLSFRGADYLGSREPWIEYPDPRVTRPAGLLTKWFRWTGKGGPPSWR